MTGTDHATHLQRQCPVTYVRERRLKGPPFSSHLDYPGATITLGFGISNTGDVVGPEFTNDFFSAHGYLFRHGTFTLIDVSGAQATWPTMAIDSRRIVGAYFSPDQVFHGFVFRDEQVTT